MEDGVLIRLGSKLLQAMQGDAIYRTGRDAIAGRRRISRADGIGGRHSEADCHAVGQVREDAGRGGACDTGACTARVRLCAYFEQ